MSSHIPRRSRRCFTCQARKKGCDLQVPVCGQCQRARLDCQGYSNSNDVVWLDAQTTLQENSSTGRRRARGSATVPSVSVIQADSLTRTARRQRLGGSFWSVFLPSGQQCSENSAPFCPGSWTSAAIQLQDSEAALCSIVLALGSGFETASCKPGISSAEQRLLKLQTIWLYYRAIWHLKDAAKNPHLLQSDGILATTKLVQLYEMYFGQGFQLNPAKDASRYASVEAHFRGQIALISVRGPLSFSSGRSHELFTDYRLYATVSTIFVRTTLSINEGEWRTVPWTINSKDPKDILTDMLHEIVSLLKRLSQLRASGGPAERRDELLLETVDVKRALQLWFSNLPDDAKVFDYTTSDGVPREITSDRQLSLLYLITLYWCACMLIDTTAGFLELLNAELARRKSVEAGHGIIGDALEAEKPTGETEKRNHDADTDREMLELGVLDASKCYAYKIAHTMHLMRGPQVGICFYSMCVVPISIASSLLTAVEPATETSEERRILSNSLASHALYNWVTQFADETEDPVARLEHEKARRLRWWTGC